MDILAEDSALGGAKSKRARPASRPSAISRDAQDREPRAERTLEETSWHPHRLDWALLAEGRLAVVPLASQSIRVASLSLSMPLGCWCSPKTNVTDSIEPVKGNKPFLA
jgi:hypothetical protein